ncbi:MAG TPA: UrcA family protein [Steroidobacteraceae bacterium]|nr:UrcA family protein [Steroidobacteraceae bacterium]
MAPITVEAQVEVHHKQVGTTYTGIPIEQVSLSREVRFTDLDLRTPNGRTMLNGRIESVARDACHQLQTLYPLEDWQTDNRTCVADAMRGARAQEHTILASMPHR